jgi:histidine triad (HIT) family protein
MPDTTSSPPPDCLFCKIAAGVIPVTRLHDDADTLAFPDINPQAPVHILIIPKRHITSLAHALPADTALLGQLLAAAAAVARAQNLGKGYRLVVNTGPDGGQTVEHLHIHLLGGRHMTWPPG